MCDIYTWKTVSPTWTERWPSGSKVNYDDNNIDQRYLHIERERERKRIYMSMCIKGEYVAIDNYTDKHEKI